MWTFGSKRLDPFPSRGKGAASYLSPTPGKLSHDQDKAHMFLGTVTCVLGARCCGPIAPRGLREAGLSNRGREGNSPSWPFSLTKCFKIFNKSEVNWLGNVLLLCLQCKIYFKELVWWLTPLISAEAEAKAGRSPWIQDQSGLHSKFQTNQGYTERPWLICIYIC